KNSRHLITIYKKIPKTIQADVNAFLMIQKNNIIIIRKTKTNRLFQRKTLMGVLKRYQGFRKFLVIHTFKKMD
ncbi:MAG: hypothetical protein ACKO96_12015, partial [Flammeovirgaceae bacterium]